MLTGLVGFVYLGFCGRIGFDLVLRLFLIVVLFVLFVCPIVDEGKRWLVVWKGGVYPVGLTLFVFLGLVVCDVVRPSLALRACLCWCVFGQWVVCLSSPPCCARPPLRCTDRVYVVTFLGGLVEVLLWLVLVVVLRMRLSSVRCVS